MEAKDRVFGAWTALGPKIEKKGCYWLCRCACGREKWIFVGNLTSGKSKSCGCLKRKVLSEKNSTHGLSKTKIYKTWKGMRQRCLNPECPVYENYGGRGITISQDWSRFENFFRDMRDTWFEGATIERIDNSMGYFRDNCKWIVREEQSKNRRGVTLIDTPWGRIPVGAAARKAGLSNGTLWHRILSGFPQERWFEPSSRKKNEVQT